MKVRIIDYDSGSRARGGVIRSEVTDSSRKLTVKSALNFFDEREVLECELESEAARPGLVLSHANDLWDPAHGLASDYIARCTQRGSMIVLYSGSGVRAERVAPSAMTIETNKIVSPTNRIDGLNPEFLCAIPYPVLRGNDLPIREALNVYFRELSRGDEPARDVLFEALLRFNRILEAKLAFLYECFDACQDPDPTKLPGLEKQSKHWKAIREAFGQESADMDLNLVMSAWSALKDVSDPENQPGRLREMRVERLKGLRNAFLGE